MKMTFCFAHKHDKPVNSFLLSIKDVLKHSLEPTWMWWWPVLGFIVVDAVCILQDPCDMVLEEVDSNWEKKQKEQGSGQNVQAEEQVRQESTTLLQVLPNILPQVQAMQEQEDAETQTERWTPLIENIKKEAEEAAIANIEERSESTLVADLLDPHCEADLLSAFYV